MPYDPKEFASTAMFCRKCGGRLNPEREAIQSSDPYYADGARCSSCGYLYYLSWSGTWYSEPWHAAYHQKAEAVLTLHYEETSGWKRQAYLVLRFIDDLQMVTGYCRSPARRDHELLISTLAELGAYETLRVARQVEQICNGTSDLIVPSDLRGEQVDDWWEEISGELGAQVDASLVELVYNRFLRDWDGPDTTEE